VTVVRQPEGTQPNQRVWRLRDRLFVVLTANMAWMCAWATPWVVEKSKVLEVNSTRVFLMMMPAGGPWAQASDRAGGTSATGEPEPSGAMTREEFHKLTNEQIPAVEVIVYVWKRVMWGVAGFLGLVALLVAITGKSRLFHLLAAVVIFVSTVATLVAMRLLIDPDYGGMEPLPVRSHVYVAAAQSAYGVVLLIAFARKPRWATASGAGRFKKVPGPLSVP